jgi:hypothetical protein
VRTRRAAGSSDRKRSGRGWTREGAEKTVDRKRWGSGRTRRGAGGRAKERRKKVDEVFASTSFFLRVEIIFFHAFDYSSLLQMFLQIDKPTS